jgi:NAD(P)-dependent dehydrogenase (short-subunit alcohol dehydrogenase family)
MSKNKMYRIAVIDGQGGGIGAQIVEKLAMALPASRVEIIALGTNALAAGRMYRAGANEVASGENAIVYNAQRVDLLAGAVGMILPFGFSGEMTTAAAEAVALSPAPKYILHLNRSGVELIGSISEPLPHLVDMLVDRVRQFLDL